MKNYYIFSKSNSPEISFNAQTGVLCFSGRAFPENADEEFQPAIDWIEEYTKNLLPETKVIIDLEYANSSTVKVITKILFMIFDCRDQTNIIIKWYYYDEDSLELAKDIEIIMNTEFELIKKTH